MPSPTPDVLDKAAVERLGRQRPELLSSVPMEVAFVATVVCSMMMSEYFIGGFFLCLPLIADALSIPASEQTWPAGVINLTTAALLLPAARLCDRFGGRIVFLFGHLWLLIWSIASGFSNHSIVLIICRAMQGVGASAFMPAGMALLGQTYRPGPRKNLVFALYGAFACIGFYFGIFMGAIAAEFLDWRWYFWIGAFLVAAVFVGGILTIPRELGKSDKAVKMDWLGVLTIVPGLILVVFAFTDGGHAPDGWATPYVYVTFILGVLLLAGAVYVEGWVASNPLLPAELFRPKGMKRLVAALFCCYGVFGLFLLFASFYSERVLHTTPLQTAAWFTPLAVGGMCLAICGGLVLHILSGRMLMIISGMGFLISVLLFALLPEQTGNSPSTSFLYWAYVFPAMLCGTIGVDITFNVTNVFITTSMPYRLQAAAGALINSLLYLGIAFWLGVGEMAVATTVNSRPEGSMTLREQYQIGFWVGVGLAVLSVCLMVTVRLGRASAELTADEKAQLEGASTQEK
ncbi:major facilitator superfamily domain-containing protein [Stachybotrys elegans]|uniref:Major facilitator superfamily domain-containing protein n=1 Tax=Stachybotrys elegans TaxID=80388 RepID=A0A8K0SEX7_9HYPO|nr:major facilitator superfamily domain-containing protein [Stachybotrys elegans]